MKKITLREGEIFFTSWEEINLRKRYRLMMLLPFLDDPYAKLLALREICQKKQTYLQIQRATNSAELIVDLFQHAFKWITAPPKNFNFSQVKSRGWTFKAPDARFSAMTFGQLVEMDSAFTRYLRSGRESNFDSLLFELYDVEEKGHKYTHLEAISFIPYPYRIDAFRVFTHIREKVFLSFRHLFPEVKSTSEKTKDKPLDFRKVQDSTPMWHSLLFSLAETAAYPGMQNAKTANMWEALTYLDEKAFQQKQMNEKT